jgi:Do/DeqQ family serine protease
MKALVLSSVLFAGVLAGVVISGTFSRTETGRAAPAQPESAPPPAQRLAATTDLTNAAERALQSVANISSTTIVREPIFRDFFGQGYGYTPRQASSLGSGVVVSADGYVLTNAHVVGDDERATVKVVLSDSRERPARVIGVDTMTDLAVLKIEGTGFTPMAWADSDRLRIAEPVLAIGTPFQLSQTVTMGIVSAVGRSNLGLANYENYIQTDAAINRGNSGGALVNTRGELVGINTAIFSETGGYQGIGFAVPSNIARRVLDDFKQYGAVRRGTLGYVDFRPVSPQLAREFELRDTRGAFVWEIDERSSAYRAGLRPADLVVSFNGQAVADPGHLNRMIADAQGGTNAQIVIQRRGRDMNLDVQVEALQPPSRRRR